MKIFGALAMLLTVVGLFSACSQSYEFVIVNQSIDVVEVRYSITAPPSAASDRDYLKGHLPKVLSLAEFKKYDRQ